AGLHPDHVRDDRSLCSPGRGLRHAGTQRLAPAAPSSLQRAELRPGVTQPLLPLPSGARSLVRDSNRTAIPGTPSAQSHFGGDVLMGAQRRNSRASDSQNALHKMAKNHGAPILYPPLTKGGLGGVLSLTKGRARAGFSLLLALVLSLFPGCRSEMYEQPRY